MEQRIWVKNYVSGTNEEIADFPAQNLPEMFRATAKDFAKKTAFTQCMPNGLNGSLRYDQVDAYSDQFALYLRETLGLEQGDRVAVQLPNCLSYPIVVFGILKAGCVLVNTNPLYTSREMAHQFKDSGAKALVIIDMFTDRLPDALPQSSIKTVITVNLGEFFSSWQGGLIRIVQKYIHKSIPKPQHAITPINEVLTQGAKIDGSAEKLHSYIQQLGVHDLALLQYTGGTTGVSKGAMLSHANLMANMLQMLEMMNNFMAEGKETVLTALPLYHIFAFTVNLMGFYFMGSHNILIPSPRPASNVKKAFTKYPISWFSGVNTLFNTLLQEDWFKTTPPKHLKATVAGGTSLHQSVAQQWQAVVGTPIVEGYGLTESSPLLSVNPLGGTIKVGSIGVPAPSTHIRLIDDEGKPVEQGQAGEIIAQGPQIMLGYWQRPDETASTLKDGWLHTGDIGTMDEDGFFYVVDRKKDMIIVSGFNVFPNEVEQCLSEHPEVVEVAVVGEPDEHSGERVKAYVVSSNPSLDEAGLRQFCKQSLTPYKVPKSIEFRQELPKSTVGKILRKDLRTENNGSEVTA
jgi:long-chain acyl-CoA synthetase